MSADGLAQPVANRKYYTIQALRALAASMVVFSHFCELIGELQPGRSVLVAYHGLGRLGGAGVDIFFCISGFVITYTGMKFPHGLVSARAFAMKRLIRIVPMYWFYTTLCVAIWWAGIGFKSVTVTTELILRSYLFLPAHKIVAGHDAPSMHPILDPGWTLTFEMYFYAVALAVVVLAGGRRIFPWAIIAIGGLWLLSDASWMGEDLRYVLHSPLLFEFCFGVVLGKIATVTDISGTRARWTGVLLMVLGGGLFFMSLFHEMSPDDRLLFWGVPGAMMVAGAVFADMKATGPIARLLVFLGAASYTIYLAHPLFVLTLGALLKRGIGASINPDVLLVAGTAFTVAATAMLYRLIEQPLMRMLSPPGTTSRR